jgi:SAM-dependent methyltransferase
MSPRNFLYATAIFLGSFLLFVVEPLAAKRLAPLLGGSAAVWTTSLVFFQIALLLGYLCAHWLATRLPLRLQAVVYATLLAGCLGQAALNVRPELHASTTHPILSVFWLLTTLIGLPFVVLSATNPLLQAWYARSATHTGKLLSASEAGQSSGPVPPYRLFALSNLGSLLALIAYPWLVEPHYSLRTQSAMWLWGFVIFAAACAGIALLNLNPTQEQLHEPLSPSVPGFTVPSPTFADRARWLLLAACGSLMLCAMTNHISQNIAAIPLLWIVPLIMYLLSFVIAFSRGASLPKVLSMPMPGLHVSVARLCLLGLTGVALGSLAYMLMDPYAEIPLMLSVPFYCGTLFVICLFCHAELHRLRPLPQHATSFYLLIAAGGALGSVFVGVVAPVVFRANYELAYGLVFTTTMALIVTWSQGLGWRLFWIAASVGLAITLAVRAGKSEKDNIAQLRNFYGTLRVTEDRDPTFAGPTRTLYNGTIQHGTQIFAGRFRTTPTSYYAHDSGVGLALDLCCNGRPRRVGVIGLGTGTLAAYGRNGDLFRFYDINPLVERIATSLFTYLRESQATIEVVPGDARLSLAAEGPERYDVIVVDAFSGDAIPVHLLTRQAVELYLRHLRPGGIIAFHVSNQFLDLTPVVKKEAEKAGLQDAFIATADHDNDGEYGADWVLVSEDKSFFLRKEVAGVATPVADRAGLRLWTDDYNSVLPLLRWKSSNEASREKQEDK